MTIKIITEQNLIVAEASSIQHIEFRKNYNCVPALVIDFATGSKLELTLRDIIKECLYSKRQREAKFEIWDKCEKIIQASFDSLVASKQANHGDFDLTDFVQL